MPSLFRSGSALLFLSLTALALPARGEDAANDRALHEKLQAQVRNLTAEIALHPDDDSLYSRRADAHFFLGQFPEALADYDKLAELDPRIIPSHWRRGLALYYVGRYDDSAQQFEKYFEHDKSDRENGIWRFYAQVQQHGLDRARKELLPYTEPDREPLEDVYRMCAGKLTPDDLLRRVEVAAGKVSPEELDKRRFYAELYVGLDYAIRNDTANAVTHLRKATESPWAQTAGYGPRYMWHVARVQLELLTKTVR